MFYFYRPQQEFKKLDFKNPAVRLTFYTAFIAAILAVSKILAGVLGESHALFADGLHSVADVLINMMVVFAAHIGGRKADENHPYGHGRIETAGTFLLALILILAGIQIILSAGAHLWGHQPAPVPKPYVLWIAFFAVIINEIIFKITLRLARKINSPLLEANAWHSRSDAAVSVIVLLGIAGALIGLTYLDAIGAVFVGIMLGKMGLGLAWNSISELVDTGVDEKTLEKIKAVITNVEGVSSLHLLRSRTINNRIFIDVHILVSPRISVSEGHYIGDQVVQSLYRQLDIQDVTVHVDPEDDEELHPSSTLPSRSAIVSAIQLDCEKKNLARPLSVQLHYLNGKIDIELVLESADLDAIKRYTTVLEHLDCIGKIVITFQSRDQKRGE